MTFSTAPVFSSRRSAGYSDPKLGCQAAPSDSRLFLSR